MALYLLKLEKFSKKFSNEKLGKIRKNGSDLISEIVVN